MASPSGRTVAFGTPATSLWPWSPERGSSATARGGPARAVGGVVGGALARRVGLAYLGGGPVCRAGCLAAMRRGFDPADKEPVAALAREIGRDVSAAGVFLDGWDVTAAIRTREVT